MVKYTNVHRPTLSVMDVRGEINIVPFDVTLHVDVCGEINIVTFDVTSHVDLSGH